MIKGAVKISLVTFFLFVLNCKNEQNQDTDRFLETPKNMVWVAPKTFIQGAKQGDVYAMVTEKPAHQVTVDGFFIDATEVTNKQFQTFVEVTGYVTVAERPINWDVIKEQLPKNTPKPHDSLLQPGSLIFNETIKTIATMGNYSQWWIWKVGANWKHPKGPGSNIKGKDNFPVVHIAHQDALAYCEWANRRLPTEAEWESAAQGTSTKNIYTWGNSPELLNQKANTWQGIFPIENKPEDGFEFVAPVKSFAPNSIGVYDMLGNVWELTNDLYNVNYYKTLDLSKPIKDPKGATTVNNPSNPYEKAHVIKGGSFLCNASYCASFRISARMSHAVNSASDHTGFRTVVTPKMLKTQGK